MQNKELTVHAFSDISSLKKGYDSGGPSSKHTCNETESIFSEIIQIEQITLMEEVVK